MSPSVTPGLKVDWCSHEAAKYAVLHWHYSHSMPASKLAKIGVWEDGKFVGAIVFGLGATPNIGKPYGLKQQEVCECLRVAMRRHDAPVSKVLTFAIRLLREANPGLRLCVSYADDGQGHLGIIYQASNWIFVGTRSAKHIKIFGKVEHPRTLQGKYGTTRMEVLRTVDPHVCRVQTGVKYKYLYPLDRGMRRKIVPLAIPYPKRTTDDSALVSN